MKYIKLLVSLLAMVLLLSLCIPAAFAEGTTETAGETTAQSNIDWTAYSYDELVQMRDELDAYIKELERQWAIENGNRVIKLSETDLTLYTTKTATIETEITRVVDDAPEQTKLVWTSSDETVAKVNSNGIVTGVGKGDAIITCTAEDDEYIFAEATVHVVLPVTAVKLSETSATLLLTKWDASAAQMKLDETIEPEDAYCPDVVWSSSNEEIATVDDFGNVKAIAPGTVTITATSTDEYSANAPKKASCTITVSQAVEELSLDVDEVTLNVRTTQTLKPTALPENAAKKTVTWESSDPEVVTVSSNGTLTAVKQGSAVITCTAADGSGINCTCKVTVVQLVTGVKINTDKSTITLNKNETLALETTVAPEDATNAKLNWESSDSSIVSVDASGKLTAKNCGAVTVTCTSTDGTEKTAKVEVYVPSIAVTKDTYTITAKDGLQIQFKYYGEDENFTYTLSSDAYFTVTNAERKDDTATLTLSPKKAGTATITLKDSSDNRNTVKINVTVDHSAAYDTTSYPTGNYSDILRNPDKNDGQPISIYGKVLQKQEGWFTTTLRVATSGGWDNVFYVTYPNSLEMDDNIIEDDYVTIYGECTGTETYTTILGGSITIPSMEAEKIILGYNY